VKRLTSLAVAMLVAFAGVAVVASPAQAAPLIRFERIQYDSPGSDTGSNTSLNTEYVMIWNRGTTSRSLTGWTVRDRQAHIYTFGAFTLAPGKYVVVRTGSGTNSAINRYQNRSWYVWNNDGDAATLRNASNVTIDSCSWGRGPGYIYC
jgi:hypothetical protein